VHLGGSRNKRRRQSDEGAVPIRGNSEERSCKSRESGQDRGAGSPAMGRRIVDVIDDACNGDWNHDSNGGDGQAGKENEDGVGEEDD
jgi:hypothetical protein